jgi:hypothetical protein
VTRVLTAVAGALALLAAGGASAATAPLAVRASFDPPTAGFGDPVRYVVDADANTDVVDPGSIVVLAGSGPLTALGPVTRTRRGGVVRVTQTLACLSEACLPGPKARRTRLPRAEARARRRDGGTIAVRGARAALVLTPRVEQSAVAASAAAFHRETDLPAATLRVRPGRASTLLILAAVALAVLAAALVVAEVLARRRRRGRVAARDPLRRALELLRESARRPPPDRRRAADLVARTLDERHRDDLADEALALAWAPPEPAPAGAEQLADRVEHAGVEVA